jgi:hypothetical protein
MVLPASLFSCIVKPFSVPEYVDLQHATSDNPPCSAPSTYPALNHPEKGSLQNKSKKSGGSASSVGWSLPPDLRCEAQK